MTTPQAPTAAEVALREAIAGIIKATCLGPQMGNDWTRPANSKWLEAADGTIALVLDAERSTRAGLVDARDRLQGAFEAADQARQRAERERDAAQMRVEGRCACDCPEDGGDPTSWCEFHERILLRAQAAEAREARVRAVSQAVLDAAQPSTLGHTGIACYTLSPARLEALRAALAPDPAPRVGPEAAEPGGRVG